MGARDIRGFRQEQRAVMLAMFGALVTTVVTLGAVTLTERDGASFLVRVQATLRIDLVVILWLAAAIANVARLRFFSAQDIGGSESASSTIREARAILQNTLEQAMLAIATHLIVAATFDRAIALIEALAALFCVGRLLFWLGYRYGARGRAFGFALTFYPNILALTACGVALLTGQTG